MLKTFNEVLQEAKQFGPKKIAVASAAAEDVLTAVEAARLEGLVEALLVGEKKQIVKIAEENGIDLKNHTIIDISDKNEIAKCAVELVRNKDASILMKGMMGTARILKAVLNKEYGLRTKRMLSHVYTLEIKKYNRLLTMTDGAMCIAPDLKQKVQIVQNAIYYAHSLGIKEPKVAVLGALELVNPDMPATMDAACLSKMSERGQIVGGIVDGPLGFDNAISKKAAEHKGINSPVSGEVDIALVPNIESGNIFAKSLVYLAEAVPAGLLLGAKAPVVLVSRSDTAQSKLYSIALGVLMSKLQEEQ